MSSTIFFFLFIPLLAFILLAVNLIFAPHNPYMEKNSAFECGYSSFLGQNRTQFSISFFIFALLFLLFDLEILLVYPYLVSAYTNEVYGLAIMLMFLLALTLGFAFELGKKALYIDSRQVSKVATKKASKSSVLGNRSIYALGTRSYSTRHSPLSDQDKYDLFSFYSLPNNCKSFIIPKKDALKYQVLKRKVNKALGPNVDRQKKLKIYFGFTSPGQLGGVRSAVVSIKAFFYYVRTLHVSFNKQGIEFRYCPEGMKKFHDMMVCMVKNEDKEIYVIVCVSVEKEKYPSFLEMKDHLKD